MVVETVQDSYVYAYDKPAAFGQFTCEDCSEPVSRFAFCARHRADMRSAAEAIIAPRVRGVSSRRKGHRRADKGERRYWRYGLSNEQVDLILAAQDGRCAICGRGDAKLHVDHDRMCCVENGRSCGACVRGLACADCLTGLSWIESIEFVEGARRYLDDPPARVLRV